ncbi:MAG: GNAT family N-acetyltransferase [Flavobacterium sp. BFFFF2]|nr:MAG: GNAT family N-acetyltransferase [Flavobacterium sp. BFFFF2]
MISTYKYSLEGQESERLLFRKITEQDFDLWLPFCSDAYSLKYIFSAEEMAHDDPKVRCQIWFERIFNRYKNNLGGMNALIAKDTGDYVGQCGLLLQTMDGVEELEIGYSLLPQWRGHGFAIEAAIKCKEFAFENHFCDSLISTIHVENQASIQVAIANGMTLEKTVMSHGDPVHIFRVEKI